MAILTEMNVINAFDGTVKHTAAARQNAGVVLSGRFPFKRQLLSQNSRRGQGNIGINVRHCETRETTHKMSVFSHEAQDIVTISPSQEVLKVYTILRRYAEQKNFQISRLYLVYNGDRQEENTLTVTVPRYMKVNAYYAVDYSIDRSKS